MANTLKVMKLEETKNHGIANKTAFYELLRADGSIVINKCLMRAIGVHEVIIYCELFSRNNYFESRNQLQDGYFFNTIADLEIGTCLSSYQQIKAIRNLVVLGLIETKVKGMPAKRYFKIVDDMYLITSYIAQGKDMEQLLRNCITRSEETKQQVVEKLHGNNTNAIIQSQEYQKNDNGASSKKESTTHRTIRNEDVINAIKVYINVFYPQTTRSKHPHLKAEQYNVVYDTMASFAEEHSLGYDEIIELMLSFFNNKSIQSDWNINHFATEGIMLNRVYDTGNL